MYARSIILPPRNVLFRDKQIKSLKKLLEMDHPSVCLGSTATGKTLVTKKLSELIPDVKFVHIHSLPNTTAYRVLLDIVYTITGRRISNPVSFERAFSEVVNASQGNKICVVVDDIHLVDCDEKRRIVTTLDKLRDDHNINLCYILVSRKSLNAENLDSSIPLKTVHFPQYSKSEMKQIVLEKLVECFGTADIVEPEALDEIVNEAKNVRYALYILHIILNKSIQDNSANKVGIDIVRSVMEEFSCNGDEKLEKLSDREWLIIDTIHSKGCITLSNLYKKLVGRVGSYASFKKTIKNLQKKGLIEVKTYKGVKYLTVR